MLTLACIWASKYRYGIFKRVFCFPESPEKILVDTVDSDPSDFKFGDFLYSGFCPGSIHLFNFLNMKTVLGISFNYHDSAASLLIDGQIVAAAQEERFTRIKHDASFPVHAIQYVLEETGLNGTAISYVVFYEKPFLKFERLLETYHAFAPKGILSFLKAIPVWMKEKLHTKRINREELAKQGIRARVLFSEHHLSHAASAFYPSPFEKAAILTIDGVGEWATTTISLGDKETITLLRELSFPHSLGLLYSAFTYYCGFKVNSGEYKLMGLAPYRIISDRTNLYVRLIKENLVDIREDGSFLLNMTYFDYATGVKMTNNKKWAFLFGIYPRKPESALTQEYMDLAYAIQVVAEEIVLKLVATAKELTGCSNLVMAGGVALNCVINGKIEQSGIFDNFWIQPAAGDAGGSLGAALVGWYIYLKERRKQTYSDGMSGSCLGPSFSDKQIEQLIRKSNAVAVRLDDELFPIVASLLNNGMIVGWFQGRMEFGPRSLGNRSILADPRNSGMQKKLNLEIKCRESFRPFAPSVLEEDFRQYFNTNKLSPYMLKVSEIREAYRLPLPAITHVDFSARVQTVSKEDNPTFHALLSAFKKLTGCSVLVNTSFNVRGEPIVCTPDDAYRCFMNTGMDYLIMGNWLFAKENQINE